MTIFVSCRRGWRGLEQAVRNGKGRAADLREVLNLCTLLAYQSGRKWQSNVSLLLTAKLSALMTEHFKPPYAGATRIEAKCAVSAREFALEASRRYAGRPPKLAKVFQPVVTGTDFIYFESGDRKINLRSHCLNRYYLSIIPPDAPKFVQLQHEDGNSRPSRIVLVPNKVTAICDLLGSLGETSTLMVVAVMP